MAGILAPGGMAQEGGSGTGCPYWVRMTPVVLLNDGSNTARIEVSAGKTATSVTWQPSRGTPFKIGGNLICGQPQQSFPLHDDGLNGDLVAGDGVFTIDGLQFVPGSCAVSVLLESQGVMSGWAEYQTGTFIIKTATAETDMSIPNGYYVTIPVVDAQMFKSLDRVTPIDGSRQQTAWLINVRDDDLQLERAMNNLGPPVSSQAAVLQSLAGNLPDSYDFRTFISTTTTACDVGRNQGLHIPVQSSVTGTGQTPVNNSKLYGTGPKLLGLTMLANFVSGISGLFYHETMHQWGAYLNASLGVTGGVHWAQASSVAGALGGCAWVKNDDGTYSTGPFTGIDGDLELYVAGLLPASQVNATFVAAAAPQTCNPGQLLKAPYKQVTINDVVSVQGPRSPAWDGAIKNYKHAMIVTSQNRLLSPLEMTYYGRIFQMWEGSTIELAAVPPYQWPRFTRGASTFNMLLDTWTGPVVRAVNIINAAGGQVEAVSPGEIIVLYGGGIGPSSLAPYTINNAGKLDTAVGGTRVLFDGLAAPLLYSSAGQVSAIVPYELSGHTAVSVQVEYQGQASPAISVPVAASAPAIFTQNQSGQGPGSILNQDGSLNTAANPAPAGSVIQVFGTGEGQSNPGGVDGAITLGLSSTVEAPTVTIGGANASVQFAGPAPQAFAGLFQVNAVVPAGLTPGAVPITIKFGKGASQPGVTVFVK